MPVDIHALLEKLPRPKKGWVLPGYKYCGPYNPSSKQLDPNNKPKPGNEPRNEIDKICLEHDIAYGLAEAAGDTKAKKHAADKEMLTTLKAVKPKTTRKNR